MSTLSWCLSIPLQTDPVRPREAASDQAWVGRPRRERIRGRARTHGTLRDPGEERTARGRSAADGRREVRGEWRHGTAGSSLIEVLVALVVVSIGLLAVEGLGIRAAHAVALAERNSRHATVAIDSLESALHALRHGIVPAQFCRNDLKYGDRLSRAVDLSEPGLATVRVRVTTSPDASDASPEPFEAESSVFLPTPLVGAVAGGVCE
jgi:hypothetical protein